MPSILASPTCAGAGPTPRHDGDDDQQQPVERNHDIVKRAHPFFEEIRRDRDDTAREPGAEKGAGIAAVKRPFPGSLWCLVRTSGGHTDNSTALSPSANAPNVPTPVAPTLIQVDLIPVEIAEIATRLAVFTLTNILADLTLVGSQLATV